jgi:hypothetical protein
MKRRTAKERIMPDQGGWLWAVIDVGFVIVLAAVMLYGGLMWRRRRRDPALERARDEATRQAYRDH